MQHVFAFSSQREKGVAVAFANSLDCMSASSDAAARMDLLSFKSDG